MRPEDLKQLVHSTPFIPVRIHLTDGTSYDVKHPDQMLIARSYVDIGIEPDPNGIFDRSAYCSLLHIVRVERIPGQKASSN